jgi:hypothetical protein
MRDFTRSIASDRTILSLCVTMLALDCGFLLVHGLKEVVPLLDVHMLHLESSRGLAERFQYLKELVIIALLLRIARRRGLGYLMWAALFAYVFCDDFFKIHQNAGLYLSNSLQLSNPIIGAQNVGELFVSIGAGSLLFALIACSYAVGSRVFRAFSHDLLLLFGLFVFFGLVLDLLPALLGMHHVTASIMVGIEEGGELIAMSLMVIYAYTVSAMDRGMHLQGIDALPKRFLGCVSEIDRPSRLPA